MPNEDINQKILAELRKLTRINQLMSYFTLAIVVVAIVFLFVWQHNYQSKNSHNHPWDKVDSAWYQMDYSKAASLAQNVLLQDTNNEWGYGYLGHIYLRIGNLTNAEAAYKRAYELYPSKDHEDNVQMVQKRIAMEQSQSK